MVFWGPAVFFRPFPCHPPYTREVGVPIRRLKILAKFALLEARSTLPGAACSMSQESYDLTQQVSQPTTVPKNNFDPGEKR